MRWKNKALVAMEASLQSERHVKLLIGSHEAMKEQLEEAEDRADTHLGGYRKMASARSELERENKVLLNNLIRMTKQAEVFGNQNLDMAEKLARCTCERA